MVVTAIERNSKRRSRLDIFVNGVIACDISRATAKNRDLHIGSDLGEAIKGFRKAMTSSDDAADTSKLRENPDRSRDEPPNGRS